MLASASRQVSLSGGSIRSTLGASQSALGNLVRQAGSTHATRKLVHGLRLDWLLDVFYPDCVRKLGSRDFTVKEMIQGVVIPATKQLGCCFMRLPSGQIETGPAKVLVCCALGASFKHVLADCKRACGATGAAAVWFDFLDIVTPLANPALRVTCLEEAAMSLDEVLVAVDPAGLCFAEPWCLLHIAHATTRFTGEQGAGGKLRLRVSTASLSTDDVPRVAESLKTLNIADLGRGSTADAVRAALANLDHDPVPLGDRVRGEVAAAIAQSAPVEAPTTLEGVERSMPRGLMLRMAGFLPEAEAVFRNVVRVRLRLLGDTHKKVRGGNKAGGLGLGGGALS